MERSTALALVKSRLPNLQYGLVTTRSGATQNLEFRETLCYWSEFEREVRSCVLKQLWQKNNLDDQTQNPSHPSRIYDDLYICGNEISVQCRFAAQIGQIMTAVFMGLGIDVNFGGYSCCVSPPPINGRVPDFAILSEMGMILAAGEAKTPWKHKPAEAMKDDFELRRILGQVIRYILQLKLRFGFLTTYEQTIFIKQERIDGKVAIYYSNVINHSDTFKDVPTNPDSTPRAQDYHGKVTLRECFFYIGMQIFPDAKNPEKHTIPIPPNFSGIVRKRPKSRKAGISKVSFQHVSDNKAIQPPYMSVIPPLPDEDVPADMEAEDSSHGPKQTEEVTVPSLPRKARYEGEEEMSLSARVMVVLGILIIILALSQFMNVSILLLG